MKQERLTPGQRDSLRRALEDKRRSLRRDIELREEEAAEGQVDSAEVGDVAEGVVEDRDRTALLEHDRMMLAEVEQPNQFKAQLKIAETQARDIQLGQPASVDTHNGVADGTVSRIDCNCAWR